jgi:hypothetical protein
MPGADMPGALIPGAIMAPILHIYRRVQIELSHSFFSFCDPCRATSALLKGSIVGRSSLLVSSESSVVLTSTRHTLDNRQSVLTTSLLVELKGELECVASDRPRLCF